MAPFSRLVPAVGLCLCGPLALANGQRPDSGTARHALDDSGPAAPRYEPVFEAFRKLAPRADSAAPVRNFTLQRDAIQFRLAEGQLYLLTPVAGRTVGAVFLGHGAVSFVPPLAIERTRLARTFGDSIVNTDIVAAVLFFTDSTLAELNHRLSFAPGPAPHDAEGLVGDALDRLVDGRSWVAQTTWQSTTLMSALLNGYANGLFYAHVKRVRGEDLVFEVDPEEPEQVALLRGGKQQGQKVQTLSQFPRAEDLQDSVVVGVERPYPVKIDTYQIEATVAKNLDFSAKTALRITARRGGVRWVPFLLYDQLKVDSVQEEGGLVDSFFRAKHSPELWVRLRAPLPVGQVHSIRIVYHGDLITYESLMDGIERSALADLPMQWRDSVRRLLPPGLDQWFFLKDPDLWFPRYAPPSYGYGQPADMDFVFHTPERYLLASVGRLVDSHVDGDVRTSHWTTERPTFAAAFNIGPFTEFQIRDPRIPPVTVHLNREAHIHLSQLFLSARDPDRMVGGDMANSLAFFTRVFGPPLFHHYYATEIVEEHGQAFPGLIHLSWETFMSFDQSGAEEIFRAHEMAHQWWGIGVEPATYRDAWLSEGFADFAGLWYMQLVLNNNEKFFKQLKSWRHDIRAIRDDALPTGLGMRVLELAPRAYEPMIYRKGAWILQMLRNMMLDLRTMKEDTFAATLQDFYRQYRGRRATTKDFQRVVEQHLNVPMGWFFDEWVDGTAIPTYKFSWRAEPAPDKQYSLHLRVRQEDVPPEFLMVVPVRIELAGGSHAWVRLNVHGATTEVEVKLPAEPTEVELNPLESVLAEVKTEGWN